MNDILKRINDMCISKGWSYFDLAKASGLNYNALNNMRNKNSVPKFSTLVQICEAFGINIEQFFHNFCEPVESDRKILKEWVALTKEEQDSVFGLIDLYKRLKNK